MQSLFWPNYNGEKFYQKINSNLDKYTIPDSSHLTTDDLCNVNTKFKLQPQQQVYSVYIAPNTPYRKFLIVNLPGTGKTCSSIAIAEGFINEDYHILVSVPKPLIENYYSELVTQCASHIYLNNREELNNIDKGSPQYNRIMTAAKKRISNNYTIETHQTFIKNWLNGKYTEKKYVIIVDEIHKLISETSKIYKNYFFFSREIEKTSHRLIGLTGTPQNDRPIQFALLSNLFLPDKYLFDIGTFMKNYVSRDEVQNIDKTETVYSFKNTNEIKFRLKGLVGYYHSLRNKGFPEVTKKFVECEMSDKQSRAFFLEAETEFETNNGKKVVNDDDKTVAYFGTRSVSSHIPMPIKNYSNKNQTFSLDKSL